MLWAVVILCIFSVSPPAGSLDPTEVSVLYLREALAAVGRLPNADTDRPTLEAMWRSLGPDAPVLTVRGMDAEIQRQKDAEPNAQMNKASRPLAESMPWSIPVEYCEGTSSQWTVKPGHHFRFITLHPDSADFNNVAKIFFCFQWQWRAQH